jgi:hypothetical protein
MGKRFKIHIDWDGETIFWVSLFTFIFLLILVVILIGPKYDFDCLEDYGENYCISNNFFYNDKTYIDEMKFYCENLTITRTEHPSNVEFYFLETEREDCILR